MARLKDKYVAEVAPALFKKFGYTSTMQVPKIEKVVVPRSASEIAKHRSRSVCDVGYERFSAGKFVSEKTIDRAETQIAGFRFRLYLRNIIKQPLHLARRKIRVANKSGFFSDKIAVGFRYRVHKFRGAAALPHDRVIKRLTGSFIPCDDRFALVGYTYPLNLARVIAQFQNFHERSKRFRVNFGSVFLNEARLRIKLFYPRRLLRDYFVFR